MLPTWPARMFYVVIVVHFIVRAVTDDSLVARNDVMDRQVWEEWGLVSARCCIDLV